MTDTTIAIDLPTVAAMVTYVGQALLRPSRPRSAREICFEEDIPIAPAYRYLATFEKAGLVVRCDNRLNRHGKRERTWASRVRRLYVVVENGTVTARVVLREVNL